MVVDNEIVFGNSLQTSSVRNVIWRRFYFSFLRTNGSSAFENADFFFSFRRLNFGELLARQVGQGPGGREDLSVLNLQVTLERVPGLVFLKKTKTIYYNYYYFIEFLKQLTVIRNQLKLQVNYKNYLNTIQNI